MTNHPLSRTAQEVSRAQQKDEVGFNVAFSILFGMAPLASSFLIFVVKEKESKAKHVQMVSGVGPAAYWLSAYAWDFITFMVPSAGCIVLFLAFDIDEYTGDRLGKMTSTSCSPTFLRSLPPPIATTHSNHHNHHP